MKKDEAVSSKRDIFLLCKLFETIFLVKSKPHYTLEKLKPLRSYQLFH